MGRATLSLIKRGVFAIHDTGPPSGGAKYHTLVILHGLAWHSDIFSRLIPRAQQFKCRLVLVNRRGYPGSDPFSKEDLDRLAASSPAGNSDDALYIRTFCKDRSKEIHDFLVDFVQSEHISTEGGISLVGWSFGTIFAMLFLAYAAEFPVGDVDLWRYIRSVVHYDSSAAHLDYPPPSNSWHPSKMMAEGFSWDHVMKEIFMIWITGYFKHGDNLDELEYRNPLTYPPPTLDTPPTSVSWEPVLTGGSDVVFADAMKKGGMYVVVKNKVLYPRLGTDDTNDEGWDHVLLRHIWCEHGPWPSIQAGRSMQVERDIARQEGRKMRPIDNVQLKGMNHFAHWDHPEIALTALLGLHLDSDHE